MAKKKETVVNNVGTTLNTEGVVKAMSEASKATDSPISQKAAADALNLLKSTITNALATGQRVQLTGFMTLAPSYRAARKGNNVITGQPMDIPDGVVVNVKAGKSLKDATKGMDASIVDTIRQQKSDKADAE